MFSLTITDVASAGSGLPDLWRITWFIENLAPEPIELLEAWLPHDQFRAARESLDPPRLLPPGGSAVLQSNVESPHTPGTIENAFLILRARSTDQGRRVFARLRVEHDGAGRIRPVLESLTTTPVGFVPEETTLDRHALK